MKASRGGRSNTPVGGKRGKVKGFSSASRRRLMYKIARVKRDAELPLFVTATYPASFPDAKSSKRHLHILQERMKRAFPEAGWMWKLEPQERGAPHYHFLIWGADLHKMRKFFPVNWYQIAGGEDKYHLLWHTGLLGNGNVHCVQQVRSFKGVWFYASKYLGKTFEVKGWEFVGQYWGAVQAKNIPFGEDKILEVTRAKAIEIMRYQKRFAYSKKKLRFRSNMSMTIFCDASQWANRLL